MHKMIIARESLSFLFEKEKNAVKHNLGELIGVYMPYMWCTLSFRVSSKLGSLVYK